MENLDFCVYRHIRLDKNTPFYVGKGSISNRRAFNLRSRSKYHKRIVRKHGCRVEIILNNLSEELSLKKEMEFIKLYKSAGYCEANFNEGGSSGRLSEEVLNQKLRGKNHPFYGKRHSSESKLKMSQSRWGKNLKELNPFYGKHHSEKTKTILSEKGKTYIGYWRGREIPREFVEKMRNTKISLKQASGKNNPRWLGYVHTPYGIFEDTYKSSEILKVSRKTVANRCHSDRDQWRDWYFQRELV